MSARAAPRRYDVPLRAPAFARGGHAQTILAVAIPAGGRTVRRARDEHREVALEGGDRLLVFTTPGSSGVRVLLFHGLGGDANSWYVRRARERFLDEGHSVWSVNHRGCGEGAGLAGGPYHSGSVDDVRAVLTASRADAPHLAHVVVGYSLSGNIALLLAAEDRAPLPDGVVAVNPPVDLRRASVDVHEGLSRIYELRFVWELRREIHRRARAGLTGFDPSIPPFASLRELDELYTAPAGGFDDALDYYARCSSLPRLADVRVPTVWITAADDPFVQPDGFAEAPRSDRVLFHLEPIGGHVGYLHGSGGAGGRWLDGALAHYVAELACVARP